MSVWLGVYLIIGAVFAVFMVYYLEWKIGQYEDGEELEKDDLDRLDEIQTQVGYVGGKAYIAFMFIVCTLFWLPMLIFNPPSRN